MSDIFVSYAREDRDFARETASSLEEEGWSVWWDRSIPTGRRYHRVIEEALAAARCVIVIWSEHSVGSDWVRAEAGEGMARNVLAPVAIDVARPPLVFRQLQTADLAGWTGDNAAPEFRRLVADIASIAPLSSGAAPEPPREPAKPDPEPSPEPESRSLPRGLLAAVSLLVVCLLGIWLKPCLIDPREPRIVAFEIDPPSISLGQQATVRWATRDADVVEIVGIPGNDRQVDARGEEFFQPRWPGELTLTLLARSGSIERRRSVKVVVRQPRPGDDATAPPLTEPREEAVAETGKPGIVLFEARPETVRRGERSKLVWQIEGATSRTVSPIGHVEPAGSYPVTPQHTTRYTLRAANAAGSVSAAVTVRVAPASGETVRLSDRLEIPEGRTADLDDGIIGDLDEADIEFEAETAVRRYVSPQNGAVIAPLPQGARLSHQGCSRADLAARRIPIRASLGPNFCLKTNQGRLAAFRVEAPAGPSPGLMRITFTTWEN